MKRLFNVACLGLLLASVTSCGKRVNEYTTNVVESDREALQGLQGLYYLSDNR